jgi:DNA-binding transcriptional MocR family regulator
MMKYIRSPCVGALISLATLTSFWHSAAAFVPTEVSRHRGITKHRIRASSEHQESSTINGDSRESVLPSTTTSEGISFSPGEATLRLGLSTGPTVWTEFGRIAQENDLVNLGQGFPDWLPPKFAVDSLVEAVLDTAQSPHQYTRPAGHPNLVNQLARRYSTHMNREIDAMNEVSITVGASQALYLSLQSLIAIGACILRVLKI